MRELWLEIRMCVADWLLGLAMRVAPMEHPHWQVLVSAVGRYLATVAASRPRPR